MSYPPMPHNLDFKSLKVNTSKTKAHFRLVVGVRAEKNLGPANFEHFWLVVWPQVINKMLEHW
jgi:hypothetical protein